MSWYELLLTLHILAIATWFGSGAALVVLGFRTLRTGPEVYGSFIVPAAWWAGRAHPGSGVVLIATGFAMVADADLSLGDTWLVLGLIGWVVATAIGGALIGRTADQLVKRIEGGTLTAEELSEPAGRILLYSRIELAVLVLLIADMVAKPGL